MDQHIASRYRPPTYPADLSTNYPRESLHTAHRRPLVEYCTNDWQRNPRIYAQPSSSQNIYDYSDEDAEFPELCASCCGRIVAVIKAPKFRRLFGAFVFLVLVFTFLWQTTLHRYVVETEAAWESMNADPDDNTKTGLFGANMRVNFPEVQHVATLDKALLPKKSRWWSDGKPGKRLIFIGDIHGCMDELQALLEKVKYNRKMDHIIATGDMINKGPKSVEVVDYLMREGASCVRGNHEDRVLLTAQSMLQVKLQAKDIEHEIKEGDPASKSAQRIQKEKSLAQAFTPAQMKWLRSCPVILRVGDMGSFGELVTVHAGLVPGISLEGQDPSSVMTMRVVDLKTHVPSQKHEKEGSVPWYEYWNQYQMLLPAQNGLSWWAKKKKTMPKGHHMTVVYGHDAGKGVQMKHWSKGLDSGCVNGGKLSAWVLGDYGSNKLVQVPGQDYRKQKGGKAKLKEDTETPFGDEADDDEYS